MAKWMTKERFDNLNAAWHAGPGRIQGALPLGLLRIAFALLLLVDVGQMFELRELIFLKDSFVARSEPLLLTVLWVWTAVLLLILVGYRTRWAAVANYAICVYMLGFVLVNESNNWQVDSLFLTLSFLLLFMPSDAVLSVSRLIEKRKDARIRVRKLPRPKAAFIHTALLMLTIGLFYLDSILYKVSSDMYLTGLGLWAPASLPFTLFQNVSFLIDWEWPVRIGGYLVVIYELVYVFLIWLPKLRIPLSLAGVVLHAGILLFFPIPVMSLLMIALHLAVVPEAFYLKWFNRLFVARTTRLTVYYDRLCPLCRQTVGVLSALDLRGAIAWKALQDYAADEPLLADIPESDLLHDIYAAESGKRLHKGVDTYAAILKATGWMYLPGLLLTVPPIRGIAARVYGAVAARRKREGGCTDATCGIGLPPQPAADKRSRLAGRRWPGVVFVALWIFSFIVISFNTPFYRWYVTGDSAVTDKMSQAAVAYKRVVYPAFGWTNHGVYTEIHFRDYRFQTRLVYAAADGSRKELPIMNEYGFTRSYLFGRQWDNWVYAIVRPQLDYATAEKGMLAYSHFWAKHHLSGPGLDGGTIEVQVKPLLVSMDHFVKGRLRQNMERPWLTAGTIAEEEGGLALTMAEGASADAESWGEAVDGVLGTTDY